MPLTKDICISLWVLGVAFSLLLWMYHISTCIRRLGQKAEQIKQGDRESAAGLSSCRDYLHLRVCVAWSV